MKKRIGTADALARLEALCARSEQCSYEITQRLWRWGICGDAADEILDMLTDGRYVDDSRYAESFVRDKYRFARWGRVKIRMSLAAKRIPRDVIDEAMSAIDSREYVSMAYRTVCAKLRQLPADMSRAEMRARLLRFAMGRGYESALIVRILDSRRLWHQEDC